MTTPFQETLKRIFDKAIRINATALDIFIDISKEGNISKTQLETLKLQIDNLVKLKEQLP